MPSHRLAQPAGADIDVEVAVAYGLSVGDLVRMLEDFPLLDRGQPPLSGEMRSTITRDTLLAKAAKRMKSATQPWAKRVADAADLGAQAYIPSEIAEKALRHRQRVVAIPDSKQALSNENSMLQI